jgi:hypothetical protein
MVSLRAIDERSPSKTKGSPSGPPNGPSQACNSAWYFLLSLRLGSTSEAGGAADISAASLTRGPNSSSVLSQNDFGQMKGKCGRTNPTAINQGCTDVRLCCTVESGAVDPAISAWSSSLVSSTFRVFLGVRFPVNVASGTPGALATGRVSRRAVARSSPVRLPGAPLAPSAWRLRMAHDAVRWST